ncbi:MAG: PIN/TRAM domain-containing protein [Halanaerobiaceae bacterium]
MLKKAMKLVLGIFGAIFGYKLVYIMELQSEIVFARNSYGSFFTSTQFIGTVVGGLLGYFLFSYLVEKILELILNFEYRLREITGKKIVISTAGLIAGLIIGALFNLSFSISRIPGIGRPLQILINLIFTYMGFTLAVHKQEEIVGFFESSGKNKLINYDGINDLVSNKILDTSVIIDGRIADICKTGFVEGSLIVPEFVLEELRHIADSSDVLKRNRGRRGLDILKQMQKDSNINVEIINQDFEDIPEVDSKLVKLAQIMDAKVLTNDYNLNKVAELQGVTVLNINELANAVKPVVLPGEEMDVKVIKEGKEEGQGVGYLDDGTMIVVDDGINYMGEKVSVLVTSILQTAAGRMIFAKPKVQEQAL